MRIISQLLNRVIHASLCVVLAGGPALAQNFEGIDPATAYGTNPNATTVPEGTTTPSVTSASPTSVSVAAQNAMTPYEAATARGPQTKTVPGPVSAQVPEAYSFKVLAGDQGSRYTLGPTDVVEINVLRHPEVSGLYIINSEGKIQYEFVGDVQVGGMTKEEAAVVIRDKLATYIVKPDVTVIIKEYNSKVVYVVGEVGLPGKVFMRGDTITVRDALLAANLPQLTAATEKATLFTPSDSGKVVPKKVNVYSLLYKGDLRENYVMNPGDTIYLPATLWAKVARFINPVTQPISQAVGTGGAVKGF